MPWRGSWFPSLPLSSSCSLHCFVRLGWGRGPLWMPCSGVPGASTQEWEATESPLTQERCGGPAAVDADECLVVCPNSRRTGPSPGSWAWPPSTCSACCSPAFPPRATDCRSGTSCASVSRVCGPPAWFGLCAFSVWNGVQSPDPCPTLHCESQVRPGSTLGNQSQR